MITWHLNLLFLQRVLKNSITFSDVESIEHFVLPTLRSRLQARAYKWFRFRHPILLSYTHVSFFIIRRLATILDHVDVALISKLITVPSESPRLFGSAFAIQSPLQDLANIGKDMTL
jgi:hypothetical protein